MLIPIDCQDGITPIRVHILSLFAADMIHFFGEIDSSGQMVLNELGQIAKNEWIRTKEIREDMNVDFGAFVVMPNHFHAILNIGENPFNKGKILLNGNNYGPQIKNLPSLIRGYNLLLPSNVGSYYLSLVGKVDTMIS
ncbi:MAG: hypothetical protein R2769_06080 [Saprospiraceae bacterium]